MLWPGFHEASLYGPVPTGSRTNSTGVSDGTIVTSDSSSGRIGCAGSAVTSMVWSSTTLKVSLVSPK